MALVYEQQTLIAMQKVHRKKQKDKAKRGKQNVENDQSFLEKAPRFQKKNKEESE